MYRRSIATAIFLAAFGFAPHALMPASIEQRVPGARQRRGKVRGVPHGRGTPKPKHHNRRAGRGARNKRRRSRLRGGRG